MKPSERIYERLTELLSSKPWTSASEAAVAHAKINAVIEYLDAEYDSRSGSQDPRDTTPLPPPPRSPLFCEHPKEVPAVCPCDDDCYCRFNSCAGPRGPSTVPPPAGANGPSSP